VDPIERLDLYDYSTAAGLPSANLLHNPSARVKRRFKNEILFERD
jgi:hypothetical protein